MGLLDVLRRDIVPLRYLNILIIPAASLLGGWTFTQTGSWWMAIQADVFFFTITWLIVWPACWVAGGICRLLGLSDPPVQY